MHFLCEYGSNISMCMLCLYVFVFLYSYVIFLSELSFFHLLPLLCLYVVLCSIISLVQLQAGLYMVFFLVSHSPWTLLGQIIGTTHKMRPYKAFSWTSSLIQSSIQASKLWNLSPNCYNICVLRVLTTLGKCSEAFCGEKNRLKYAKESKRREQTPLCKELWNGLWMTVFGLLITKHKPSNVN